MTIRKPVVAGQFYPEDKTDLKDEVKEYLNEKNENISACISPHAGYVFSGKLMGDVLGRFRQKKDFIILGVNHSGLGARVSFSSADFETPLGIVKNNLALGEKILKKLKKEDLDVAVDELPHNQEHSIEVLLPFLQESQKKFSIVPILLSGLSYEECVGVASIVSAFIDENIGLIISSDFTHYGANYGFYPFNGDLEKLDFSNLQKSEKEHKISEVIKKNLYYFDNEIIINILNKNSKKVFELASKSTICGLYGITIISEIAKIKNWKAKLVEYYTSGDVVDKWDSVVGYAGISFG